ncbi:MAG: response regulator transcription factor [Chloroflexota bacterium]
MTGQKILVVDDEAKIVNIVRAYLEREGYQVLAAHDGRTALELARQQSPDLIVLDLMLPEVSGWDVCRTLRQTSSVPIIMLTARDEDTDKIVGLELGADDYLTKPFNPKELVSRVRAVLRRSGGAAAPATGKLAVGALHLDVDRRQVSRSGQPVTLTPLEFELLRVLAEHPGRVFSRLQLLDRLQGDAYEGYERTIDSHIKNLRQKIETDLRKPQQLITVYGVGYKLEAGPGA